MTPSTATHHSPINSRRVSHIHPGADEKYDHTQKAWSYASWINHTASAVWKHLDGLEEDFAVVVQSNAGAVGWEIAKAHRPTTACRGHLDSEKMWRVVSFSVE